MCLNLLRCVLSPLPYFRVRAVRVRVLIALQPADAPFSYACRLGYGFGIFRPR
jgi:hypothetical protein